MRLDALQSYNKSANPPTAPFPLIFRNDSETQNNVGSRRRTTQEQQSNAELYIFTLIYSASFCGSETFCIPTINTLNAIYKSVNAFIQIVYIIIKIFSYCKVWSFEIYKIP